MSKSYWASSLVITIAVDTNDDGIITYAPPIARKFIEQPLDNLRRWMQHQGGYIEYELSAQKGHGYD